MPYLAVRVLRERSSASSTVDISEKLSFDSTKEGEDFHSDVKSVHERAKRVGNVPIFFLLSTRTSGLNMMSGYAYGYLMSPSCYRYDNGFRWVLCHQTSGVSWPIWWPLSRN